MYFFYPEKWLWDQSYKNTHIFIFNIAAVGFAKNDAMANFIKESRPEVCNNYAELAVSKSKYQKELKLGMIAREGECCIFNSPCHHWESACLAVLFTHFLLPLCRTCSSPPSLRVSLLCSQHLHLASRVPYQSFGSYMGPAAKQRSTGRSLC